MAKYIKRKLAHGYTRKQAVAWWNRKSRIAKAESISPPIGTQPAVEEITPYVTATKASFKGGELVNLAIRHRTDGKLRASLMAYCKNRRKHITIPNPSDVAPHDAVTDVEVQR